MNNKKVAFHLQESNEANFNRYENDYRWKPRANINPEDVRSTAEMMALLESDAGKDVEVSARIISHKAGMGFGMRNLDRKQFIETYKANEKRNPKRFKEAYEDFARGGIAGGFANTVGQDFTPLLGGPFYKQLYYYNDWLKAHQDSFYAFKHDGFAKSAVNILVDFTLGRGFAINFENQVMQAIWDAFEKANDFQEQFRNFATELSAYGESMWWKLPDNERYIVYPRKPLQIEDVPHAFIPRIRVIDPSNIVEIVTYPEDLSRKVAYVWLTPTQYQIYSAKDEATGKLVSGTKLIYQQIPASQMLHYAVNRVSNEKRGRSDLFAALPYFKRLRDSVNYELIAQQKNAAWAIDTTIQGDEQDIAAYKAAQLSLGTIPNAGSEFIHTEAIKREYLANQGGRQGTSNSFEWCLSMIAASVGIPVSYFGTHISGGQTRASAIVATEPVAKRFEMRQQVYKKTIEEIIEYVQNYFGIKSEYEITFPEIITQDRSAKLKDIQLGEAAGWWSHERAAEMAAIEMNMKEYNYEVEQQKIAADKPAIAPSLEAPMFSPLTAEPSIDKPSAVTSDERKQIKKNGSP